MYILVQEGVPLYRAKDMTGLRTASFKRWYQAAFNFLKYYEARMKELGIPIPKPTAWGVVHADRKLRLRYQVAYMDCEALRREDGSYPPEVQQRRAKLLALPFPVNPVPGVMPGKCAEFTGHRGKGHHKST